MAIYPQAILSMIEINKASDVLQIVGSAGTYTLTPSYYTYANVIDLVYDMNQQLGANGDIFLLEKSLYAPGTYDKDFVPVIELTTGSVTSITAGTIKDILFDSYTTDASRTVADVTPLYSWIPRYRSNDGTWFKQESDSIIKGSIGVSGNLSGIEYTPRQKVTLEFPFVAKTNTFYDSGLTDENLRSFENVINGARANVLQYSGSNNINCKGVYYIYTIDRYIGTTGALMTNWGDGFPNDETAYTFCTAGVPQIGGNSEERLNTFYDCSLELTTATAPTWSN